MTASGHHAWTRAGGTSDPAVATSWVIAPSIGTYVFFHLNDGLPLLLLFLDASCFRAGWQTFPHPSLLPSQSGESQADEEVVDETRSLRRQDSPVQESEQELDVVDKPWQRHH